MKLLIAYIFIIILTLPATLTIATEFLTAANSVQNYAGMIILLVYFFMVILGGIDVKKRFK